MWATDDAERLAAALRFAEELGPCPHCGQPAVVEVTYAGTFIGDNMYLPIEASCSADCWQEDPQGYLDAVAAAKTVEHDQTG